MHRLLPFCLLFLFSLPAQAGLLEDLEDSLLWGTTPAAPESVLDDTALSAQPVDGLQERNPFAGSQSLGAQTGHQPSLLLMPAGEGEDSSIGIGIRFSF